ESAAAIAALVAYTNEAADNAVAYYGEAVRGADSTVDATRTAAKAVGVVADADAATQNDYEYLIEFTSGEGTRKGFDNAYFGRPLWPNGEPPDWDQIISNWRKGIEECAKERPEIFDIFVLHERYRKGAIIDWKEAIARVKAWANEQGLLFPVNESIAPAAETVVLETSKENMSTQKTEDLKQRTGATPATPDLPSKVDLLGREALVNALATMFAAKEQATPFTMVLLGDWGAGKSSVMEQLQLKLSGTNGAYPCSFRFAHFNAWEYEHSENIRAGLAQEVIKGLLHGKRWFARLWLKFGFACREHPWELSWGLTKIAAIALTGAGGIWWLAKVQPWGKSIEQVVGAGFVVGSAVFIRHAWNSLSPIIQHPVAAELLTYMKLPDYGQHLGLVPVMKKHIKALCELTGMQKGSCNRLVVFVDDLDRCSGECIVATLDAARLVMDIPNTIVVIAIDDRIAFNAVAEHYHRVSDATRDGYAIARDYLGKIIQLCVKLEQSADMRSFIDKRLFASVKEPPPAPPVDKPQGVVEPLARTAIQAPAGSIESNTPEPSLPVSRPAPERSTAPPVPAFSIMPETTTDRDNFAAWAEAFQFGNPRQLVRLRNTYRLLLQLNTPPERRDEGRLMALLFWLEYLSGMPEEKRQRCEDVLLSTAAHTPDPSPDILALPAIYTALTGPGGTVDTPQYMRDKAYISLFVLPYGHEKETKPLHDVVNGRNAKAGAPARKASSKRK
ncbi:MAG: P-loop NTPase fold protein, partial [FCB group bacterium]|nr:P-loop NTPase fold protein [FCB group bacterium]